MSTTNPHLDFEYSSDDEFRNKDEYPDFGLREYWDQRYKSDSEPYDWYFEWSQVSPLLTNYIKSKNKTLVIGCGNSTMSAQLIQDHFERVISIDISDVVIKMMKETYKNEPKLEWYTMSATQLSFDDECFDVVFDKGTIDAIICNDNGPELVTDALTEIYRVLKHSGKFIVITFESPSRRLKTFHLAKLDWYLHPPQTFQISDNDHTVFYIYVLEKK